MLQLDLFAASIDDYQEYEEQPKRKESEEAAVNEINIKVGDAVRLKKGVLSTYEEEQAWESYYYLLDAKGIGNVLSEHERKGGKYYIVAFGKVELYVTDDELEVV